MADQNYAAILDIVATALDDLAAVASPTDSGIALITAGMRELSEIENAAEALAAYRDTLGVLTIAIAERIAETTPTTH